MTQIYGQVFTHKFGLKDNGIWFEALKDLTPKALENGLKKLLHLACGNKFCEFPPNSLQFRALCLAYYESLHLPKASEAYQEVKQRSFRSGKPWSHRLVKFVARRLPPDFLLIEQEYVAYALFKKAYEEVCHLVQQGHVIPDVEEPSWLKPAANKALANYHLQQIKACLGVAR